MPTSSFSRAWRAARLLAITCALACAVPTLAQAAPGQGRALGVITFHGGPSSDGNSVEFNTPSSAAKSGGKGGGGKTAPVSPLTFHGGGVFTSPYRIYDIYWNPSGYSMVSGYQTAVDSFAQNVAADSGKTSNVFYSDTQYTDGAGNHIPYAASFGGSATATDPFPASACTDTVTPSAPCLSDNQVASVIQSVATAHGWSVAYPNIFVVMMPNGVGNCASYMSGGLESYCSFTNACAWHHQWASLYFVVQPYVATQAGCRSGQSPSGAYDADQAINTISHELNESLTDPAAAAWFDTSGNENGDKCAWNFGTPLGGASGKLYNQLINGAQYFIQQEWSNQSSKCVLTGT
jgi:hypothetical protein